MKKTELSEHYKLMFSDYPEIIRCNELQSMLGVSKHAVYRLLNNGHIGHIRIGRSIRIPKINVIRYLIQTNNDTSNNTAIQVLCAFKIQKQFGGTLDRCFPIEVCLVYRQWTCPCYYMKEVNNALAVSVGIA